MLSLLYLKKEGPPFREGILFHEIRKGEGGGSWITFILFFKKKKLRDLPYPSGNNGPRGGEVPSSLRQEGGKERHFQSVNQRWKKGKKRCRPKRGYSQF